MWLTNTLMNIFQKNNEFIYIFLFFGVKNLYFNKYFVVLLYLIPKASIRHCPFVVITGKQEEKARTRVFDKKFTNHETKIVVYYQFLSIIVVRIPSIFIIVSQTKWQALFCWFRRVRVTPNVRIVVWPINKRKFGYYNMLLSYKT